MFMPYLDAVDLSSMGYDGFSTGSSISLGGDTGGGGISISLPSGGGGPSTSETLTSIVNAAESALKANIAQWQTQAISADAAISRAWAILNDCVSRLLAYGAEGQKAASERDRRIAPAMLRWDWIAYYIDPITGGQTAMQPLPTTIGGTGGGSTLGGYSTAGIGSTIAGIPDWALVGAVIVALLFLSKKK